MPEYRDAIAREKLVKSAMRVGITFGFLPPFAQRGVPEMVRITSWSASCAARTASSMSSKTYAGSNGFVGLDGRVLATRFHWTSSRMIVAFDVRRSLHARLPVAHPAEARIVVEAHPHALGSHCSRGGEAGEHGQNDDEADDTSHEVSQGVGGDEGRSEDLGTLAAAM